MNKKERQKELRETKRNEYKKYALQKLGRAADAYIDFMYKASKIFWGLFSLGWIVILFIGEWKLALASLIFPLFGWGIAGGLGLKDIAFLIWWDIGKDE